MKRRGAETQRREVKNGMPGHFPPRLRVSALDFIRLRFILGGVAEVSE